MATRRRHADAQPATAGRPARPDEHGGSRSRAGGTPWTPPSHAGDRAGRGPHSAAPSCARASATWNAASPRPRPAAPSSGARRCTTRSRRWPRTSARTSRSPRARTGCTRRSCAGDLRLANAVDRLTAEHAEMAEKVAALVADSQPPVTEHRRRRAARAGHRPARAPGAAPPDRRRPDLRGVPHRRRRRRVAASYSASSSSRSTSVRVHAVGVQEHEALVGPEPEDRAEPDGRQVDDASRVRLPWPNRAGRRTAR